MPAIYCDAIFELVGDEMNHTCHVGKGCDVLIVEDVNLESYSNSAMCEYKVNSILFQSALPPGSAPGLQSVAACRTASGSL